MQRFYSSSLPQAFVGVGLRHSHYENVLSSTNKEVDFVEIHAENFFAKGGISQALLKDISRKYQVSVHGTSLGLGSSVAVPADILKQFSELVKRTNAVLVSEHLCFNRAQIGKDVVHTGDLLPLIHNSESLNTLVNNIDSVQNAINQSILIENLSAYIEPSNDSEKTNDYYSENEFLTQMCRRSGCGLLLDVNNLIVNAKNMGVQDVVSHVTEQALQLPAELIGEIHLAGYSEQKVEGYIIDDHANYVSDECWQVYQSIVAKIGNRPTLVEWDNHLPTWQSLLGEADKAKAICQRAS